MKSSIKELCTTTDWSNDGRYILYSQQQPNSSTKSDIVLIDLKDKTSRYISNTEFTEENGIFSDNMKWIIYDSDESGKPQIYVQPFGSNGMRSQLTADGGTPIRWIDNDRAIVYQWQNLVFKMGVRVSDGNLIPDKPEELFNTTDKKILRVFDVTKDGKTFLCSVPSGTTILPPLTYIQNWQGLINTNAK